MKPFVFVNVAASVDGKISNERRVQLRISSKEDMERVDKLRAESDAIMVGIGTVLADNPKLTVKSDELRKKRVLEGKPENPLRVVVDSKARIPEDALILNDEAETLLAVSKKADLEKLKKLQEKAMIFVAGEERVDLSELMEFLYHIGVRKLMVEGGGELIASLFREGLVDEIYVYYGNVIIAGKNSPTIADGKSLDEPAELELLEFKKLGGGILTRWRVKRKRFN
ncbi:2,5-diamino-6-hydroxy-4-(5-phosphoribosylamino)pyrimidine 1-reductase [Ferroglobus placidus DSM 10642]|uniref:2,5-diamino-6-(ribosylamino)-4(3H)-pyrimidinone 5'-phosphate reductase n=1 Tax=Ferroglobus placidus (strain DSM 10642 / AEDII12DO) TaxID=589924 RepID=D3RY55_FERPA|nr:2,5-diamino-6-(ribosylamino)-4(3H)-pyrimidinone 5'-phosphate reductase [Ferroglobus placidus]ADC65418.1 2,5-diamino-6-hydroxy-4-(5-phosphoribosylamino)pyrimidine 1-reductase [Ferroglobus placidus DSM 10642]